ncbi:MULTISPECIES: DUF4396 domain-containing protein [Rhodomicrobium]|uniref:DUF4396 domain-containing protein n=1 Tax=Rhodomicrobium TaxID=1068 RepID=UPI000F743C0F|nr:MULTISPECIES: DUF4396 domain-containing protein [Rhodomicrobium]
MDPDMVRQQEEAEAAARLRSPIMMMAAPADPPSTPPGDHAFTPRIEPREDYIPAEIVPEKTAPGWGAVLRATFYSLFLTGLGLMAGIMFGVKLGLVPWQSLLIGSAAGFLLGWLSAVGSLRKRYKLSFLEAYRAPLAPTGIILAALILSMAIASLFTDISPTAMTQRALPTYWVIVSIGGLIGYVAAAYRMRKSLWA